MKQDEIVVKCGGCGYRHPVIKSHPSQRGGLFISSIPHNCEKKRALFGDEIGINIYQMINKFDEKTKTYEPIKVLIGMVGEDQEIALYGAYKFEMIK